MKRLQVMVTDELMDKLDFYANKMGVSRSAFCCMMLGQGVMSYDNSLEIVQKVGLDLASFLSQEAKKASEQ